MFYTNYPTTNRVHFNGSRSLQSKDWADHNLLNEKGQDKKARNFH